MKNQADEQAVEKGCARSVSTGTNRTGQAARDSGDSARKSAERYCPNHIIYVILIHDHTESICRVAGQPAIPGRGAGPRRAESAYRHARLVAPLFGERPVGFRPAPVRTCLRVGFSPGAFPRPRGGVYRSKDPSGRSCAGGQIRRGGHLACLFAGKYG